MSVWHRVLPDGSTEPLSATEDKRARGRFRTLMDTDDVHLRMGATRRDGTEIRVIGTIAYLHGPDGCCTCCHGRTAAVMPDRAKAQALARVEAAANADHRSRIDAAIRELMATGREFSANDLRDQLADVPGPLIGARFNAAAKAGVIVQVGYVPSTKGNTHAHEIKTWKAAA